MTGQPGSNSAAQAPDFLSMSDEEIANLVQPSATPAPGDGAGDSAAAANDDAGAAGGVADGSAHADAGVGTEVPAAGAAAKTDAGDGNDGDGKHNGTPGKGSDAGRADGSGADSAATVGAAKTVEPGQGTATAAGAGESGSAGQEGQTGASAVPAAQAAGSGSASGAAVPAVKKPGEAAAGTAAATAAAGTEKPLEFYKTFHDRIMGPIKANGKTLELKSPEEAIQLMQMGANYTQKMQALAPHRKLILMLGNNDLLNEDRLSFLIDLNKGNPEAIKKLLADHKVDPLDINTDEASHYQSGNHNKVTDQEAAFRTTLEDLGSTPEGQETLREINGRWDQASKEVLWNNPEIMSLIHEQRSNGIYETISNEVNRRRVLGVLPAQVSFLQAYKAVGDELAAAGAFAPAGGQSAAASAAPAATPPVVVTRVAMPKTNGNAEAAAKASAASAPRGTPSQGAGVVRNPLEMSDADILAMATPK